MKKLAMLIFTLCGIAAAQTTQTSGLLTGAVTYTSPLNNSPYGNHWSFADDTICSTAATCPYIVKYPVGTTYSALAASDATGNCYSWDVWQLILGSCQSSFHGGAPGENAATLYCANSVSSDINGKYTLSCTASFDGTAITVEGGVDVTIPTAYTVNVTITHHPVSVWIGPVFRRPRHLETWQAIDSAVVTVTPIAPTASAKNLPVKLPTPYGKTPLPLGPLNPTAAG